MIYDWYKIANKSDLDSASLVSKEVDAILDGVGQKKILVTKGNLYSILVDGVFLSIGLNDQNPFAFEGYAAYMDANEDIWLGIEVES